MAPELRCRGLAGYRRAACSYSLISPIPASASTAPDASVNCPARSRTRNGTGRHAHRGPSAGSVPAIPSISAADLGINRRPAAPVRAGPSPADQPPVPAQQRARRHRPSIRTVTTLRSCQPRSRNTRRPAIYAPFGIPQAEPFSFYGVPAFAWKCLSEQRQIAAGRQVKDERDPSGPAGPGLQRAWQRTALGACGRVSPPGAEPPPLAVLAVPPARALAAHATSADRRARWLRTCGWSAEPSAASMSSRIRRAITTAPSVLMWTSR